MRLHVLLLPIAALAVAAGACTFNSTTVVAGGDAGVSPDASSADAASADGSLPDGSTADGATGVDGGVGTAYGDYTEGDPPATVQFTDVCGMNQFAKMGTLTSSTSEAITAPFPIHLYADTYSDLRVSTAGWLSFSQFISSSAARRRQGVATLPSAESPNAAIYAMWEDLGLRDDKSVCYGTVGAAPSRAFVVQWNNAFYNEQTGPDGSLTFQVRFNEADDTIDLLYETVTPGAGRADRPANATIGVENEAAVSPGHVGTLGKASAKTPAAGLRIRFTPVPLSK